MRYLFIGAHTDDIELSCGGTIAKLIESNKNYNVHIYALSYCDDEGILNEYKKSAEVLGVCYHYNNDFDVRCFSHQQAMIADALLDYVNYDLIFTHSDNCRHPDHKTVGEQSKRIYNGNLIMYQQGWNENENPNYFIELSEEHLEKKIAALSCYKSQSHRPYMNPDFIRSQAIYNGIKCGKRYAEAFRIEKLIN